MSDRLTTWAERKFGVALPQGHGPITFYFTHEDGEACCGAGTKNYYEVYSGGLLLGTFSAHDLDDVMTEILEEAA